MPLCSLSSCHLQLQLSLIARVALRFIPYICLCGGACFHLICHNSECPAGHSSPASSAITHFTLNRPFFSVKQRQCSGSQQSFHTLVYKMGKTAQTYAYFCRQINRVTPLMLALHVSLFTPNLAAFAGLIVSLISNLFSYE